MALETKGDFGYSKLLEGCSGDLSRAAWRLASRRLEASSMTRPVPTRAELHVAAMEICARSRHIGSIPSPRALASMAESNGLPVINPMRSSPPTGKAAPVGQCLSSLPLSVGGLEWHRRNEKWRC